jgi:hypothetical protein
VLWGKEVAKGGLADTPESATSRRVRAAMSSEVNGWETVVRTGYEAT